MKEDNGGKYSEKLTMAPRISVIALSILIEFWANAVLANPIHDAVKAGDIATIQRLLSSGSSLESESPMGTPLLVAVRSGQLAAITYLLEEGADPNAISILGTPLIVAMQRRRSDIMSILLDVGADPDLGGKSKPLHIALRKGDWDSVRRLILAGADPDITEKLDGITPLHFAASKGLGDIVTLLLDAGANPNLLTPKRETALHFALQSSFSEIAALLAPKTNVPFMIEPIDELMENADADRGEILVHGMVADCAMCHIMGEKPDQRYLHFGPTLWDMEGVDRAYAQDYDYSETLRTVGGQWTLDSLNWLMAAPAVAFPGTHKNWYPITEPQVRADVVAYLRSLGPPPKR